MIRIKKTSDKKLAEEIMSAVKENGGHCCCAIEKTSENKCMCKEFLKKVDEGYKGPCHCGLYISY